MNDIYMLVVGKDSDTNETTLEVVQYEEETRKVLNFFVGKESENILAALLSKSQENKNQDFSDWANDVYFSTFSVATLVLEEIQKWANDVGSLTIGDYYDAAGHEGNCAVEEEYGWTKKSLMEACVLEVEEGEHKGEYILYLPELRDIKTLLKAGK